MNANKQAIRLTTSVWRQRSYTFFTSSHSTPQKSKIKSRSHTQKLSNPRKISTFSCKPQAHFSLFFTLGLYGGWSQEAPREGPYLTRPLETPCLGFCTSERIFTSGGCLRRQDFPTWLTHVIYAAAALAGDDSPGRQCTEMMSHVCVCQAYTCEGSNVVKNVRKIENDMDSHCWHFLGLKTVNLRSTCAQIKLSLHEWDILLNGGKDWCTMATCTGGKDEFSSVQ